MSRSPRRLRRPASILAAALLWGVTAVPGQAQVNVERLRLDDRDLGLTGRSTVTFTLESGNAEKQRADALIRLDWLRAGTESFVVIRGDFDWTAGRRVTNDGLVHARHILRRGRRVSPELFGQVNYDQARDLDFRALVGVGARTVLHEGERDRVSLGLAYMFEREELGLPPGSRHPLETSDHRASSFLTVALQPREGLALASTTYVQPRLDRIDDLRVLSQSRMAVQLLGPLSLDVSLDLAYDADPPDHIEELDTALKMGVGIRF